MGKLVMAFSGPSSSGKTTLISKLTKEFLARKLKVAVIKHDPADKASFDTEGKDSFKFFQSGADVLVLSPKRSTLFSHSSMDIEQALSLINADLVLVEGLKTLKLPRISVFCKEVDESYFKYSQAISSYEKPKTEELTWLHLDDINGLCEYILKNAKELD